VEIMSNKKTKKTKSKIKTSTKTSVPRKDPRIEKIYEKEVEFTCPVRGKIKQIVKIKKYKTTYDVVQKETVRSLDSSIDLDKIDDGLSIYPEDDSAEKLN
jgi:hypothetical protein